MSVLYSGPMIIPCGSIRCPMSSFSQTSTIPSASPTPTASASTRYETSANSKFSFDRKFLALFFHLVSSVGTFSVCLLNNLSFQGSFPRSGFTFKVYYPSNRTVEDRWDAFLNFSLQVVALLFISYNCISLFLQQTSRALKEVMDVQTVASICF